MFVVLCPTNSRKSCVRSQFMRMWKIPFCLCLLLELGGGTFASVRAVSYVLTFVSIVYTANYLYLSPATINLYSTPEPATGVCIGDKIVFTCKVLRTGILQWAVDSINTNPYDPIQFHVAQDALGIKDEPFPDIFNATLLRAEQNSTYDVLGNLTSEITVIVTSTLLGKHVYCSNGSHSEGASIIIEEKCKLSN